MTRIGVVVVTVLTVLIAAPAARAAPVTANDIAEELACQCGCGMTAGSCNHQNCGSSAAIKAKVQTLLDQGRSEQEILASFVSQYGDVALAEPPKRGFNLLAWLLPFVALMAGGLILARTLTHWLRRERMAVSAEPVVDLDPAYAARLREELADRD